MATLELGSLLRSWEAAAGIVAAARGAALIAEAGLVSDLDAAIDLPINRLASLLARMHHEWFGSTLAGALECAACRSCLDLDVPLPDGCSTDYDVAPPDSGSVVLGSARVVRIRVPTTRDLMAVRERADVEDALVARCVGPDDATAETPGPFTAVDRALVDARLEELAGAASMTVRVRCPECGMWLSAPVDVATFLWERIEREARAGLEDVAELASTFGWAEVDILGLTARRRKAYLTLARGGNA